MKHLKIVVAILVLSSFGACIFLRSTKYRTYPDNPFQDIRTVAVFPFLNGTAQALDGMELAQIFSSELVKFPGFKVIRPNVVAETANREKPALNSVADLMKFGRTLKADAVIVATVTEYDPYRPPRIALSVQMFRMTPLSMSAQDISELVRRASWAQKPMAIQGGDAAHVISAFENMYDSHSDSVRAEVQAYAEAQEGEDYAYASGQQFLSISSRYMQFVSSQVLLEIVNRSHDKP